MQHLQVIENFVKEGRGGRGTNVVADEKDHALYSSYRSPWNPKVPFAVQLADDSFLANGQRLMWPMSKHQRLLLQTLEEVKPRFGVVPFDSITAAWTDGEVRDWRHAPFKLNDLRQEVEVVVSSVGEQWREVMTKDKYGREKSDRVHTLGDSVVRVRDHFYLSG